MERATHVLHVITTVNRGGAENHLLELVRHQRARGMEVTVAYLRGDGYWVAPLRALGAEVYAMGLRAYGDWRPLQRLVRLLRGNAFTLVHAHLPPAELYCRVALKVAGLEELPFLISKHNDCAFHRLPGERMMGRWVARRAEAVIAISEAVRRYMIDDTLGLPEGQVRTILYGIDPQPFEAVSAGQREALRRQWGCSEKTLVVGCVGRFVEQKSIDTLIRAFALFLQGAKCEARLVLVGHGPMERQLREQAEACGVGTQVIWAGFRPDIPVVMSAFDLFALSSVFEGFGLVLLEAMAAGLPVLATRAGAIGEVVVDGVTGILAQPRQALGLMEGMARLSDRELRLRMGSAGRARVKQKFTLEAMCARTDALYQQCVREAGREGVASV